MYTLNMIKVPADQGAKEVRLLGKFQPDSLKLRD